MKFLVTLSAAVAAVSAQVVVPHLTTPYAYGLHAFGGKSAPCVNAANLPVPCAGAPLAYAGYPFAAHYGKREAEAEPEADAYYGYYGHGLGYAGYGHGHGYGYGHAIGYKSAPCVNAANVPVPCAAGYGHHYGYAGHYGKREAEADAQVVLAGHHGLGYAGLGYAGLGYAGLGYAGLGLHGLPNPVHAVVATAAGPVHSSHVGLCTNYLGAAVPCRRKREAEAEADADAYYGYYGQGLGYAGYGHAGLGYAGLGYAGLGYAGLGYHGVVAAPAVAAVAPVAVAHAAVVAPAVAHAVVAPVAAVHTAVLGTAALPNPVHAVAHTIYGTTVHSSHVGVCTNYLGAQVPC